MIKFNQGADDSVQNNIQNVDSVNSVIPQSKSIIDQIMDRRQKEGEEAEKHLQEQLATVTAKSFFGNTEKSHFCTKEEFLNYIYLLTANELKTFEALLEMIGNKIKLTVPPFPRKDKSNRDYYWIRAASKNGAIEFKLVLFEGMERLIRSYLNNEYHFDISLSELYVEAQEA